MAKWEVCIAESRDLIFEVEAESQEGAYELAMESDDYVRDNFRERVQDWAVPIE